MAVSVLFVSGIIVIIIMISVIVEQSTDCSSWCLYDNVFSDDSESDDKSYNNITCAVEHGRDS